MPGSISSTGGIYCSSLRESRWLLLSISFLERKMIMTDSKANEAALDLMRSLQAANKAIVDTAATTQERNLAFVQTILESGIEVLKNNAEGTRSLIQELVSQTKNQQPERLQTL